MLKDLTSYHTYNRMISLLKTVATI